MMQLTLTRPSIARRLLIALLLAYLVLWVVVAGIATSALYRAGSGDFDREMSSVSDVIQVVLAEPDVPFAAALRGLALKLDEDGRRAGADNAQLGFRVYDARGVLLARGGAEIPDLTDDGKHGFFDVDVSGQSWRLHRQVSTDGQRRIDVAQSLDARLRMSSANLMNSVTLLQLVVGFPLLCIPIWLAVRTGLAPLLRLSRGLAGRAPGDLDPVRVKPLQHELVPLVEALNSTLARLSELLGRERAFLADAAHELRTPLAVISAQYDTLRQAPAGPERDEAMQRLSLGVARAARLVTQLLALATLEADVNTRLACVDLADQVRDCLALHAPEAAARDVELSYHGRDSLLSWCHGPTIETILHNLVSNAIRHGRPGGQVEVSLDREGDRCVLCVSDDGPGIGEPDRLQVFERFWRGAAAGGASPPGSGLGLAIVAAAARQIGGRVDLSTGLNGRGLKVTLSWPFLADDPSR
jgi:signal transduction histidine kinase